MESATSRDVVLANFQVVTGIDDFEQSLAVLEKNEWDFEKAVEEAMLFQNGHHETRTAHPTTSSAAENHAALNAESVNVKPTSITFIIHWKYDTIILSVPETEKIKILKERLQERTGILCSNQCLEGWPTSSIITDETIISSLKLRKEVALYLLTNTVSIDEPMDEINVDHCNFVVHYNGSKQKLYFPWCTTLHEVREQIATVTDIPIKKQKWTNFPEFPDDTTLENCHLSPIHELGLSSIDGSYERKVRFPEADSSEDDYYDSLDSVELRAPISSAYEPLMPDHWDDVTVALAKFNEAFEKKYGPMHPLFFIGPLSNAIEECFAGSVARRKPLFVYIHNDSSVQVNLFCSNVLCSESVVTYLNQNYVNWAWDVTLPSNREKLSRICSSFFGSTVSSSLERFDRDQFPIMLVITKVRSSLEISRVLQADSSVDELFTSLMGALEDYRHVLENELRDEEERKARNRIKKEQDAAYEASLRADRAKAEARAAQEEEKNRLEKETQLEKERQELALIEAARQKEAKRLGLEKVIPEEPADNCNNDVVKFLIRLPSGERLSRSFYLHNTIEDLLNYVAVKGFPCSEFKVVTNFPKREISALKPSLSLKSAGFGGKDTLFVQEL